MQAYLKSLIEDFGNGWNRFWFEPSNVLACCVMRLLSGTAGLLFLLSYNGRLTSWFAAGGMLPVETARRVVDQAAFRWSFLQYVDSPGLLWACHGVSCLILAAFTLGWKTRITSVLSAIVVLSYIHRTAPLSGPADTILILLLLYLCLAPCGERLSLDARFRKSTPCAPARWTATLAIRLMQVHIVGYYLLIGLSKLGGSVWWDGQAIWTLVAQTHTRPIDLTGLRNWPFMINLWTHSLVAFELVFPILIWNHRARPLLLACALAAWCSVALLSGQALYCLLMAIGSFCFVSSQGWARMLRVDLVPTDSAPPASTAR